MIYLVGILAAIGAMTVYEYGKGFIRRCKLRKSGIAKKQFMQKAYMWGKELEFKKTPYSVI